MNCQKCNIEMRNFHPKCHTLVICDTCGEVAGDPCLEDCKECGGQLKYSSNFSSIVCVGCGKVSQKSEISEAKEKEPEFPPLVEQATNFGTSMVNFVRSGFELAGKEEKERRLKICYECDKFDRSSNRCMECGCNLKAKAGIGVEKCPLNKW